MIVSMAQPGYLPWLGHYDRVIRSDVHVVFDNVPFGDRRNSAINRTRIRSPQGDATWLTVPLTKPEGVPLNELLVADQRWKRKHFGTLKSVYSGLEPWLDGLPYLRRVYERDRPLLMPLLEELDRFFRRQLAISTQHLYLSTFGIRSRKSQLCLDVCRRVGADVFLSGPHGRDYLDLESFARHHIEVRFHDYVPAEYPQRGGFLPGLSALDAFFNLGPHWTRRLLDGMVMV